MFHNDSTGASTLSSQQFNQNLSPMTDQRTNQASNQPTCMQQQQHFPQRQIFTSALKDFSKLGH